MSILPDHWIRTQAQKHKMIEPFVERQERQGVISYGLSSYGYDDLGAALRSTKTWATDDVYFLSNVTDPFGFGLLASGVRGYSFGTYAAAGYNSGLWTADGEPVFWGYVHDVKQGMTVRCKKD